MFSRNLSTIVIIFVSINNVLAMTQRQQQTNSATALYHHRSQHAPPFVPSTSVSDACSSNSIINCPPVPSVYIDLGCKPVHKPNDCCPYRFECPSLWSKRFCQLRGKLYSIGEKLSNSDAAPCTADCVCTRESGRLSFDCPITDCGEFFPFGMGKKCIIQKKLSSCCADNVICDSNAIAQLDSCYWSNQQYRIGEIFYPRSEPCYRCSCTSNFRNDTNPMDNSECQRVDCLLEIHNHMELEMGCAPIYFPSAKLCCPINFRCPNSSDYVVNDRNERILQSTTTTTKITTDTTDEQCSFGKLLLNIGESLNALTGEYCTKCTCRIPPHVECLKTLKC